ncbi:PEP-CTERM sorting domain-containing protein [Rariglobus hedericola]|uniref:PEP-CTERM sorting domain-containing protein n=1 Tax=Rariglobus hedericola TaxID=2597822 RepID=A0A556QS95_9BACT|nr:PEP-CTERM sorting domain-containing protein [Rariglobus hedericola]TSJ79510.1 PEP-CTERM sorting domain-containing protein [Rariglobus hedericola]
MNYPTILARFSCVFFAFAASLPAQTLVQYAFTTSDTVASRNASTTGTNVTPEAFANGAGVTITSSMIGSPTVRSYFVTGDLVDEVISATSTDWLGFTINANSGYQLNLQNLSFAYAFSFNAGTAPATAATYDVRSSLDNYASSISVLTASVGTVNAVSWSNASIVLTDAAYQNLSAITFRIFLNDGTNTNAVSYVRLDTVTLTGIASAVPEPSTYALMSGAAGLVLAGLRRRLRSV